MKNVTLPNYQDYLRKVVIERGFEEETAEEVFLLLVEEIGELAKAMRKNSGIKSDKSSRKHNVEEETADVFFLLVDLCNRLDIDLEKAFNTKEKINSKRTWS